MTMDMKQYLVAMEWLRKETESAQSRLENLEYERKVIAGETDQARNCLKAVRKGASAVKLETAKAEQELSQSLQALEREKDALRREIAEKRGLLCRKRGESAGLASRLSEVKSAMSPVVSEMEVLNGENTALEADIAELDRRLQESGGLKRNLEELAARLAAAMALKTGFARKGEFTRALLEENPELKSQDVLAALERFQALNAELQEKVFEWEE